MLISHDIDLVLYHFLHFREILIYAILTKGTNELVKQFNSYNALIEQLTKNRKCSLENLIINTIGNGNCELLDLLEKSDAEPCRYFNKHRHNVLISNRDLDTIMWFNKRIRLNMKNVYHRIILNACYNEKYLQTIIDCQQFISDNLDRFDTYIGTTIRAGNFNAVEWFHKTYPKQSDKYLIGMTSDLGSFLESAIEATRTVRWLTEHKYLVPMAGGMHYLVALAVIKDSATTDIYRVTPLVILNLNPTFICSFVSNAALIQKWQKYLLQYRSRIVEYMRTIIKLIIEKNDINALNWLCTIEGIKVVFHRSNIELAFQYGRVEIIQYLVNRNYIIGRPYHCLRDIIFLNRSKAQPVLELFEKMKRSPIDKKDIIRLINIAISTNNSLFLEWLFKYFKIEPSYFSAGELTNICSELGKHRYIDVTKFFVCNGYNVRLDYDLDFVDNGDSNFLKYILRNKHIEKNFHHTKSGANIRIIATHDLEILRWYMENYISTFDHLTVISMINCAIEHGTDKMAIWLLNYTWSQSWRHLIFREGSTFGTSVLYNGRIGTLDWLREKQISIEYSPDLIDRLKGNNQFNAIWYLRKYCDAKV